MNVNVSIGGISTSLARARALALVRSAIAKREAELGGAATRSPNGADASGKGEFGNSQATRGK
jgi:hypothetical protein